MSALEEIQAAIDKLTKLRDAMSPGVWYGSWDGQQYSIGSDDIGEIASATYTIHPTWADVAEQRANCDTTDLDLIVTLHRTIDAQLAILQDCLGPARTLDRLGINPEGDPYGQQPDLDLARAINGPTS